MISPQKANCRNSLAAAVYDCAFPRRCPFCRRALGWNKGCRAACLRRAAEVLHLPHRLSMEAHCLCGLEGAASVFRYEGVARRAILNMKYRCRPWYARELGFLLAEQLFGCTFQRQHGIITLHLEQGTPPPFDLVVSVPSSRRDRGFDSTALMAATLAAALGLPYRQGALVKIRTTPPQAGLSREERLVNVIGSMAAAPKAELEGKRVLLVDDVITTGATVNEAARALDKAGALEVFAVSVAAAEPYLTVEETPQGV